MSRVGKTNLAKECAEQAKVSEAAAGRVLAAALDVIIDELAKGNVVTLPGFGTWRTRVYAPRKGRNPRTGAELQIGARTRVVFKAGSKMQQLAESTIDPAIFFGDGVGAAQRKPTPDERSQVVFVLDASPESDEEAAQHAHDAIVASHDHGNASDAQAGAEAEAEHFLDDLQDPEQDPTQP